MLELCRWSRVVNYLMNKEQGARKGIEKKCSRMVMEATGGIHIYIYIYIDLEVVLSIPDHFRGVSPS